MVRPVSGLVAACVAVIVAVCGPGCSCRRDYGAVRGEIGAVAAEIDGALAGAREQIRRLRGESERVLTNRLHGSAGRYPQSRYALFQNKALYTPKEVGGCSVWASGFVPVDDALRRQVSRLEYLEPALLTASKSAPEIAAAYFTTRDSVDVACPFYEGPTYLTPGQDLRVDFVTYRQGDAEHNPGRRIRWVDPYVDAVGSGYMISVINPVYTGDAIEGVLGIDITIAAISKRYLGPATRPYLIFTPSGFLVASNRAGRELLGSAGMERYYYLKGAEVNEPPSDSFRLTQHSSNEVRGLAARFLEESEFDFRWRDRDYHAIRQLIPEVNWFLVGIETR